MGMFDTVKLRCPYCGETTEEQTKSGPCMLKTYTLNNAPISVMGGILGEVKCEHCEEIFKVETEVKPKYRVVKIPDEPEY